ncbi:uncharacterized protein BO80DRAFT_79956 [Aspergillus ibericus CBS 121593]|uniref:Uncharacterized protein n=1 Tax=Aspergillus ibericus CBS 121593 TaxID=1448316 RepID=A0A395HDJ9_9EURO|nr:hypothetical protein BO80DRAFT_79956 [Aspergillus ibericus CBS 121593]RAL05746.1 hypothetical protein BO80DRAFT_79956 [Aspergillus ibericus CBS 121593]
MHGRVIQTLYIPHLPCYAALSGVWLLFFALFFTPLAIVQFHMCALFSSFICFDGSARVKRDTATERDSFGRPVYLISLCMDAIIVFILSQVCFTPTFHTRLYLLSQFVSQIMHTSSYRVPYLSSNAVQFHSSR